MIVFDSVRKAYNGRDLWQALSISFEEGRSHIILGESGVGKTTALRLLLGLTAPDSGSIRGLEGKRISAVFQENRLCEELTVSRNIRLPMSGAVRDREEQLLRIGQMLSDAGMPDIMEKRVSELSGGMKRRVAILRAIMCPADIYVFDEPLQGLDDENRSRMLELILRCTKGHTLFWVTHDLRDIECLRGASVYRL